MNPFGNPTGATNMSNGYISGNGQMVNAPQGQGMLTGQGNTGQMQGQVLTPQTAQQSYVQPMQMQPQGQQMYPRQQRRGMYQQQMMQLLARLRGY